MAVADPGFPRWDVNPFFENRMNMKKIWTPPWIHHSPEIIIGTEITFI